MCSDIAKVVRYGKANEFVSTTIFSLWASQVALVVKNLPANAGVVRDDGSITGWGRSPDEGHGNRLEYSWLENPMDRGAWGLQFIGCKQSDMTEAT